MKKLVFMFVAVAAEAVDSDSIAVVDSADTVAADTVAADTVAADSVK